MNLIKVATGTACGILIVLIILIFKLKNPELALYEHTVEILMLREGMNSMQEVMECFPELKQVQAKMKRIAHLSRHVRSMTEGPAPVMSQHESQEMKTYSKEIKLLKESVKAGLAQMVNAKSLCTPLTHNN